MLILCCIILAEHVFGLPPASGVDLLASWYKPPFELSVIEAISDENSSAYYPLLGAYTEFDKSNDKDIHESLFAYAIQNEFITPEQKPFVDLKLGLHEPSAIIQAYYQYFETAVLPQLSNTGCDNILSYDGGYYCDISFQLKSEGVSTPDLLPNDKIYGDNEYAPIVILYADLLSEDFKSIHGELRELARSLSIRYIARYKPSRHIRKEKESLGAYGVEVSVLDGLELPTHEVEKAATEFEAWKNSLASLGYKAAKFITRSPDDKFGLSGQRFNALTQCSLNFPTFARAISKLEPDTGVQDEVARNFAAGRYRPGSNFLLVNGAPESTSDEGIFAVIKAIDRERKLASKLSSEFGTSLSKATELISNNYVGKSKQMQNWIRYDYRTPGLIWLNDIESDEAYTELSDDWSIIFDNDYPGDIFPIRHNANTAVFALDLTNNAHLLLYLQLDVILRGGMPIQMGIIPLTHTPDAAKRAKMLHLIHRRGSPSDVINYLQQILKGKSGEWDNEFSNTVSPSDSIAIDAIFESTNSWMKKFGIDGDTAVVYANGISLPNSPTSPWFSHAREVWLADKSSIRQLARNESIMSETGSPLRDHLIDGSLPYRNPLITPADDSLLQYIDTTPLVNEVAGISVPNITLVDESNLKEATIWWYIGDFCDKGTLEQTIELIKFMRTTDQPIQLNVLPILNGTYDRDAVFESLEILDGFTKGCSIEDAFVRTLRSIYQQYREDQDGQVYQSHVNQLTLSKDSEGLQLTRSWSKKIQDLFRSKATGYLVSSGRLLVPEDILNPIDLSQLYAIESTRVRSILDGFRLSGAELSTSNIDKFVSMYTKTYYRDEEKTEFVSLERLSQVQDNALRVTTDDWLGEVSSIVYGNESTPILKITAVVDPLSEKGQFYVSILRILGSIKGVSIQIFLSPKDDLNEIPIRRYYDYCLNPSPVFDAQGMHRRDFLPFRFYDYDIPGSKVSVNLHTIQPWITALRGPGHGMQHISSSDLQTTRSSYELQNILLEGYRAPPYCENNDAIELRALDQTKVMETNLMNLQGYFQLAANPGTWRVTKRGLEGLQSVGGLDVDESGSDKVWMVSLSGSVISVKDQSSTAVPEETQRLLDQNSTNADINVVTMAYDRSGNAMIHMMVSAMKNTNSSVKFWIVDHNISPSVRNLLPKMATQYSFGYSMINYQWPRWMWLPSDKQAAVSGVMFLDAVLPRSIEKVIWLGSFSYVRTDLKDLVDVDLGGAPYALAVAGESRIETERFWKSGDWHSAVLKNGKYKFHSPDMAVVDLPKFRENKCGDIIRGHYQLLSARYGRIDQGVIPNMLQDSIPIHSLESEWFWHQLFDSDESIERAKIINLANGRLAKSQVPGLSELHSEIAGLLGDTRSCRYHDEL
ncbi:hypothetical protein TRVA0_013S01860 [Trichomonascus vanleenenianus]|uniref:uncharacterized protein n=1 Tax=Trichomonascus vanleenenianus TaxID=2268995 RepID=UPI003ECB7F92